MNNKREKDSLIAENQSSVQSVRRAADILECVSSGFNSVAEIAAKCDLHKSTVHRLLKTLGESRLVIQNPFTRQYYPGYRLVKLSLTPMTTHEFLIDKASEEMLRLSHLTSETIDLRIKIGLENIGLYLVQSKYDRITVGDSLRIRLISLGVDGRVLLSQLDDEELSPLLRHIQMGTAIKGESIDIGYILDEITDIRQKGYAIAHNELINGVTCICAPVKKYIIPVSLSIVRPEARIKPSIQSYIDKLLISSTHISRSIAEYDNKIL